jgi:hypothetical protein
LFTIAVRPVLALVFTEVAGALRKVTEIGFTGGFGPELDPPLQATSSRVIAVAANS